MITMWNHTSIFGAGRGAEGRQVESPVRIRPTGTIPDGYLPDEDDPAWPSKSGQAD
jgi:hypothetical protein